MVKRESSAPTKPARWLAQRVTALIIVSTRLYCRGGRTAANDYCNVSAVADPVVKSRPSCLVTCFSA